MPFISRRSVLKGIGCACAVGTSSSETCANIIIKNILCATHSFSGVTISEVLKSTGNSELDSALSSELEMQSAFFGYRPAFILYNGGEKNAAATPEKFPEFPQADGAILYNLDMLNEQLSISHWGGTIISGVIAHEFGHIYQNFSDYMKRLAALDATVKFIELHADFLSGFYMGSKYGAINIKDYANAFYEIGDYGFKNPDHHGTPAERYLALKSGYNLRIKNRAAGVHDAAREAESFLKEYIHA